VTEGPGAPPGGLLARRATPADLHGVAALLDAYDIAQLGDPDPNLGRLRGDWESPWFEPERDATVAVDPEGRVLGYAEYATRTDDPGLARTEGFAIAHPGAGASLTTWLVDTVDERSRARLGRGGGERWFAMSEVDATMMREAESRGWPEIRRFAHLRRDLIPAPPADQGPLRDGATIRPMRRPDDERVAHAVLEEAFATDFGWQPTPFEAWAGEVFGSPGFVEESLLLLEVDGTAVGVCLEWRLDGEVAWIADVGVVPSAQRRGYGSALLRRAFGDLAGAGYAHAQLNVDMANETQAMRVYQAAGMRERRVWRVVQMPTVGGAAAGVPADDEPPGPADR